MSESNINTLIICSTLVLVVGLILLGTNKKGRFFFLIKGKFKDFLIETRFGARDELLEKDSKKRKSASGKAPIRKSNIH